jgi:hypothetical protein
LGATEATALALEVLDRLCDEWGFPRYFEIDRYQMKWSSSGDGEVGYFLRDKERGVVVHGKGRSDASARRYVLYLIRQATTPEQLELCWPKRESLHASLCTCPHARDGEGNFRLSHWDDPDYEAEEYLTASRA